MIADILNGRSPSVLAVPSAVSDRLAPNRPFDGRPDPTRSTDLGWLSFG